jgi:hypothetical protein
MNLTKALRRFNDEGLYAVSLALLDIDEGKEPDLSSLLESDALTEVVPGIEIAIKSFTSRESAGKYFFETLEPLRSTGANLMTDKGLWTWLAMSWIDELAPKEADGSRKLHDHRRWILSIDGHYAYYRHHLAGPYYIYDAHHDDPKRAAALLCGSVSVPGEVWEQIASRQVFAGSPNLMALVTKLYFDSSKNSLKRGAASQGAGGVRRLPMVINQFSLTWDVEGMPVDRILNLLPAEFNKFR